MSAERNAKTFTEDIVLTVNKMAGDLTGNMLSEKILLLIYRQYIRFRMTKLYYLKENEK